MSTFEQGAEFAGHRIEGELGSGGMAVVYRARHLALDQPRALKLISPRLAADAEWAQRFRLEARLAASIDHPAVVRVYDSGEWEGRLFISMQLIEGVDLSRVLAAGPLDPRRALEILGQVATGLDAAHDADLVHRDVKPENILLAETPAGERAYLTDFGIGTSLDMGRDEQRLTSDRQVIGTASYISPEQIAGEPVDARSDVYSFGCLAFEALTGTVPFAAETQLATLSAHGSAPRPAASAVDASLPEGVDRPLAAAMAIDPAARPARASAFVAELDSALGARITAPVAVPGTADRKLTQPLPDPASGARRRARLRRRPAVIALALLAVAALIAGLLLAGSGEEVEQTEAALTVDVPRDPVSVAPGAEFAWVASGAAGRISSFEAETGAGHDVNFSLDQPRAAALGPGYLWVVTEDSLTRFPLDGSRPQTASEVELPTPSTSSSRRAGCGFSIAAARTASPARSRSTRIRSAFSARRSSAPIRRHSPTAPSRSGSRTRERGPSRGSTRVPQGRSAARFPSAVARRGLPPPAARSGSSTTSAASSPRSIWGPRRLRRGPGSRRCPIRATWRSASAVSGLRAVRTTPYSASTPAGATICISEAAVGEDPADIAIGGGHVWTADTGGGTISRIDP